MVEQLNVAGQRSEVYLGLSTGYGHFRGLGVVVAGMAFSEVVARNMGGWQWWHVVEFVYQQSWEAAGSTQPDGLFLSSSGSLAGRIGLQMVCLSWM